MIGDERLNQIHAAVDQQFDVAEDNLKRIESSVPAVEELVNEESYRDIDWLETFNQKIDDILQDLSNGYTQCEALTNDYSEEERDAAIAFADEKSSLISRANQLQEKFNQLIQRTNERIGALRENVDLENLSEPARETNDAQIEGKVNKSANKEVIDLYAAKDTVNVMDVATEANVHLPEDAIEQNPERVEEVIRFGETVKEVNKDRAALKQWENELNELRAKVYELPAGPERQALHTEWVKQAGEYAEAFTKMPSISESVTGVKNAIKDAIEVSKIQLKRSLEQGSINKADRRRLETSIPDIKFSKAKADVAFFTYNIQKILRENVYVRADAQAYKEYVHAAKEASRDDKYVQVLFLKIPVRSKEAENNFINNNPFDSWKKNNENYIENIRSTEEKYSDKMQACLDVVDRNNNHITEVSKEINSIMERNPDVEQKFWYDVVGQRLMDYAIETGAPLADAPNYVEQTVRNEHTDKDERTFVRNEKVKDDDGEH